MERASGEEQGKDGTPQRRPRRGRFAMIVILCAALSAGVMLLVLYEPPETIEVTVQSFPPDAELRIDGRVVGRTPYTERLRPAATPVLLEIYADGYWPARRTHTLRNDAVISVQLEELPADSNPRLSP